MFHWREDGTLETSFTEFTHPYTGHTIGILSCVHLGPPAYFTALQNIIDSWEGLFFEEKSPDVEQVHEEHPDLTRSFSIIKDDRKLYQMLGPDLLAQREHQGLVCPEDRAVSADIPLRCVRHLFDFVEFSPPAEETRQRMEAALWQWERSTRVVYWYLKGAAREHIAHHVRKERAYAELRNLLYDEKNKLLATITSGRSVLREPHAREFITALLAENYGEALWNVVPERDTYALMMMDQYRGSDQRLPILFVYGAGHYAGLARGLYDRGYQRRSVEWYEAGTFPRFSYDVFVEALEVIVRSYGEMTEAA